MSVESKMAEDRSILKVRVGSHLYGTNTPTSDEDFVGIFVPPARNLIGLGRMEQIDASVVSKGPDGKNTADAVDCTYYTLEKFARLALDGNPNIVEILFANSENMMKWAGEGAELLRMKKHFLSKLIKHRFLGYAFSQKHKMVIKLENYEVLYEAQRYLENTDRSYLVEVVEIDHHPLFHKKKDHVTVGDINIPLTSTVKKAKAFVDNRLGQFGSRQQLVTKFGYDTKFASHLIRLIVEGIELLKTGDLKFPLQDVKLLKSIRNGECSMQNVLKMAERYEAEIEEWYEKTELPDRPNFDAVEKFVMKVHTSYLKEDLSNEDA